MKQFSTQIIATTPRNSLPFGASNVRGAEIADSASSLSRVPITLPVVGSANT